MSIRQVKTDEPVKFIKTCNNCNVRSKGLLCETIHHSSLERWSFLMCENFTDLTVNQQETKNWHLTCLNSKNIHSKKEFCCQLIIKLKRCTVLSEVVIQLAKLKLSFNVSIKVNINKRVFLVDRSYDNIMHI